MKKTRSLFSNFIRAFIFIVVVPTFLMNSLLYGVLKQRAINDHSAMMVSNMEYISKNIEDKLREVKLKTSMLVADRDIHQLLYEWSIEESSILKDGLAYDIDGYITGRFDFLGEIESAYFFLDDENYYSYNGLRSLDETTLRNESWYEKSKNVYKVRSMEALGGSLGEEEDVFTIVSGMDKFVSSSRFIEPLEVVVIKFKNQLFDGIYSNFKDVYFSDIIIFDEFGNVRLTSNSNYKSHKLEDFPNIKNLYQDGLSEVNTKESIYSIYETPKSKWLIANRSDLELVTKNINQQLFMFNIFFILILLLFTLFSVFYFNRVVTSLRKLVLSMRKAEKGQFKEEIDPLGYGEVRELEYAFNNMIREIHNLMIQRDIKESEKREEEIKALQAQINPHFIYNTLNCIRLMSMMSHQKNITDLTDAFMMLLSGMFKDQKLIISVESEISYLKHYIYIMKVRFGETFSVHYDIEEGLEKCGILKLVLQPIVENAITHGVSQREEGGGVINIRAFSQGENLIFQIEDNGPGISPEKQEELLGLNHSKRVGVRNVNRRVKLNYGQGYGLKIESEPDTFTKVLLTIPRAELI